MNIFDKIIERRNTDSLKWDALKERFGKDGLTSMWVADMDFPSPDEVTNAIIERARHQIFGYPIIPDELNQSIIDWNKKRNNFDIDKSWIVHTPGVVTSLCNVVLAFTEVNDKILIQTPVYYPFYHVISDNGRKIVTNPLIEVNGKFTMDFDDLETKFKDGVKMMILCSPHNPIGRVWTKSELDKLAKLCLQYNVLVISDEIHSDLVFDGNKHISFCTLFEEISNNTITLFSPTKTFNIAGLSHSMAIIKNAELRNKFISSLNSTGANMLNVFGMVASNAAYSKGEIWLEDLKVYLKNNLDFLVEYFEKNIPQIKVIIPESTYLVWLDCSEIVDKVGSLKGFFVNKANVAMNDGIIFGVEGKNYQRLNFACPREILVKGLISIENAVKSI